MKRAGRSPSICMAAFLAAVTNGACDRPADERADVSRSATRVASLSPALTDIVLALDCGATVVARTPWCRAPGEVPVAGTLLDVDAEMLTQVDPDILLVQPPAQGAPYEVTRLAQEEGWTCASFSIQSLEDVREAFVGVAGALDARAGGAALGRDDPCACRERAMALVQELDDVCRPLPEAPGLGTCLVVGSLNESGCLAFGPGSYLAEALRSMGLVTLDPGAPYASLSLEDVARLDPAVVLRVQGESGSGWADAPSALPRQVFLDLREPTLLQPGASLIQGLEGTRRAIAAHVRGSASESAARANARPAGEPE